MNAPPPPDLEQPSSCWLRGCLILAMVIPTIMLIMLASIVVSRLTAA